LKILSKAINTGVRAAAIIRRNTNAIARFNRFSFTGVLMLSREVSQLAWELCEPAEDISFPRPFGSDLLAALFSI
jgi:uncharacterized protein (UPF0303 family)